MGNSTSQSYTNIQDVQNNIVQSATSYCKISVNNDFSNNTVIFIGGSGNITFSQQANIDNATCNMTTALDASIENILESISKQDATAKGGFSINWSSIDEDISIYQYVKNSVTQIMTSECNISASNSANNNYFYVEDRAGDFYFNQNASVTNATCNMNSAASAEVYNKTSSEGDQTSKIVQMNPLLAALGVCMILGFIVFMIILFKGSGGSEESSGSTDYSALAASVASSYL